MGNLAKPEVQLALARARSIQQMITDMDADTLAKAPDFFNSILTKAADIAKTIEKFDKASPGQINALANMEAGVKKWIH